MPPPDLVTVDGYDLQFGTNVLGHYYLTTLLLPILLSTAKVSPNGQVRVVNVSSGSLNMCPTKIIDWDTLQGTDVVAKSARARLGGPGMLYSQSKAARILVGEVRLVYTDSTSRRMFSFRMSLQRGMLMRALFQWLFIPVRAFDTSLTQ